MHAVRTGWTGTAAQRTDDDRIDQRAHHAKVRLAGSDPVFRSRNGPQEQEGRDRLRCPDPGRGHRLVRHIRTGRAKGSDVEGPRLESCAPAASSWAVRCAAYGTTGKPPRRARRRGGHGTRPVGPPVRLAPAVLSGFRPPSRLSAFFCVTTSSGEVGSRVGAHRRGPRVVLQRREEPSAREVAPEISVLNEMPATPATRRRRDCHPPSRRRPCRSRRQGLRHLDLMGGSPSITASSRWAYPSS